MVRHGHMIAFIEEQIMGQACRSAFYEEKNHIQNYQNFSIFLGHEYDNKFSSEYNTTLGKILSIPYNGINYAKRHTQKRRRKKRFY